MEKNIFDTNEQEREYPEVDYRRDILEKVRSECSDEELIAFLEDYHGNDIAYVLEELDEGERARLLSILGSESVSRIFSYVDDVGEYLTEVDELYAADIIAQMEADEALEALEKLDEEQRNSLLDLIEPEAKEEIQLVGSYEDDEFGSIMSSNFVSFRNDLSVKAAMRELIAQAADKDNISTVFTFDGDGKFYGAIDLKELIVARSDKPLEELIYTAFPFVYDKGSISENAESIKEYSEELLPVISAEDGRILGVITAADIVDIVDSEFEEDYARLAALGSQEDMEEPVRKSLLKRLPWLAILLALGLVVSAVVGMFEGVVKELPLIVSFQSLILGMAGNVGTQSLAVTVRTLGKEMGVVKKVRFVFKELRVAMAIGLAIGFISFVTVGGYLWIFGEYSSSLVLTTAGCVGVSICFAMIIAGFTGATIPMIFNSLGIDPAIASGPLITTFNDLAAVISYYGLAWILFLKIGI